MKKSLSLTTVLIATVSLLLSLSSCSDDNMDMSEKKSSIIKIENIVDVKDFVQSGTFEGKGSQDIMAPVVLPGQSVEFKFSAGKGQKLMFATMYGASKDWFFAPENPGIELYKKDGAPIIGDISSEVKLWDNGSKDDTGADDTSDIKILSNIDASKLMKLELSYEIKTSEFTLKISNTSGGTANETPFSPGVWAISNIFAGELLNSKPFYVAGQKTNVEIQTLAEKGDNSLLAKKLSENTGIITGLSPVIVVVYTGEKNPIYELGQKDAGLGLKELSQTGNPAILKESLGKMANVKSVYILGSEPIVPKASLQMEFVVSEGDYIAYATMFGYSNDWFIANSSQLSAQFKGDATSKTGIFDNGTAVDQFPGAGNAQGLFGGLPIAESLPISKVTNTYPVPSIDKIVKITIQ